ncbi:MAG: acetyl-CoA carboxylase biotin carboxyl carrier protein subunit [Candidatus Marinimicrobia bacterium]|jgi:biotin carboxyl carrier protein|nr:acetyl-CoA carboxylase biotin carboxyl carrier protein subunit [Candidatus Neomarinimicrobiota bacterium]
MKFNTIIDGQSVEMEFSYSLNLLSIKPEKEMQIDLVQLGVDSYSLILDGKSHHLTINKQPEKYEITVDHYTHLVQVQDEMDILLEKFGMQSNTSSHAGEIHAQIPGLVSQLFVRPGDNVDIGQKLLILEAMKMENEIDSPIAGIVNDIHIKSGDKVEKGELIMDINN